MATAKAPPKKPAPKKTTPKPAPALDIDDLTLDDPAAQPAAEKPEVVPDDQPEGDPARETAAEETLEDGTPADSLAAPDPAAAARGPKMEIDPASGYDVVEMPLLELQPNKLRVPTAEAIDSMARSIKKQGLLDPIIITDDGFIVAGNTRFLAFQQLKRATIPSRFVRSIESDKPLTFKERDAQLQAVISNLQRTDMTPVELGRAFSALIKSGTVADAAELARETGRSTSEISRVMMVFNNGSEKLKAAIAEGKISFWAAHALVSRAKEAAVQDKTLDDIAAATEGKITSRSVRNAPSRGTRSSTRGARPKITELSHESLKSDQTGVVAQLRKTGRNQYLVDVRFQFEAERDNFARFDVAKKVQSAVLKIEPKVFRDELELARARLED